MSSQQTYGNQTLYFGGEKKLFESIVESSKAFPDAQAVFVYATCVAGLIGDDIVAVAKTCPAKL